MLAKKIPSTELTILPGYDGIFNYITGNPAYPLTSYCIKEFSSPSNNGEEIFKNMLKSTREFVNLYASGALSAFAPYVLWSLRALNTRPACLYLWWTLLLRAILKCPQRKLKRSSAWNLDRNNFWLILLILIHVIVYTNFK